MIKSRKESRLYLYLLIGILAIFSHVSCCGPNPCNRSCDYCQKKCKAASKDTLSYSALLTDNNRIIGDTIYLDLSVNIINKSKYKNASINLLTYLDSINANKLKMPESKVYDFQLQPNGVFNKSISFKVLATSNDTNKINVHINSGECKLDTTIIYLSARSKNKIDTICVSSSIFESKTLMIKKSDGAQYITHIRLQICPLQKYDSIPIHDIHVNILPQNIKYSIYKINSERDSIFANEAIQSNISYSIYSHPLTDSLIYISLQMDSGSEYIIFKIDPFCINLNKIEK